MKQNHLICTCDEQRNKLDKKINDLTTKFIRAESPVFRAYYISKIRKARIKLGVVAVQCPVHQEFN